MAEHQETGQPARIRLRPVPSYLPGWVPAQRAACRRHARPSETPEHWDPRAPTADSEPPRVLRALLTTYREVLNQRRPASQLAAVLPADALHELRYRARREALRGRRYRGGRVHWCQPNAQLVEAAATMHVFAAPGRLPQRTLAIAIRLEWWHGQWRCTVLTVL
ncbi:hypothetical protein EV191_10940 [Tamaricihabitans halophyticus]|uniref:Uncharacterized protein n=1 Tax=Tamaricihabitans halophyticus TaxID=1262583 RepID=A0A4R2QL20_9PSEU|nr:Rv3235 family protein [Tamaricihabitans halophyticus]TCP49218.1 hypothetical protein EV191_10940 [Tamaricihabitans halophyticus]